MKKIVVLVLLAGVGIAFAVLRNGVEAGEPAVMRAPVSWGAVYETVRATGTLEPLRRVNVGSQVSGTIKALHADYNSVIRAGQLLAEIDSSLLEAQVAIQQASIDRQKGEIANQEMILADQRNQFARTTQLHEKGLQNQQQHEAAALAIKVRESQIFAARKQLVQAEANLEAAKLNVGYATIRSPIDGVVIQRRANVGQTIQASVSTPQLFLLCTPLQLLKLTAWVDEADIGRVRPGLDVRFQVGTYGAEDFVGTVESIRLNASATNSVVTYPVWINVPNDELRLRPGMTAQVSIQVSTTSAVARIPNGALRFRPTRAVYEALGAPMPDAEPQRAIDHAGDRMVDPTALRDIAIDENATSIDELFAPLPKADARATVWTWNETSRRFRPIPVRVGVTDGAVTELLSGDIEVGDELVTSVVLPAATNAKPVANPLMGPQRGRGGR